ncbi:MAG: hypothetical protein ACI9G1_000768 [Pirellulaceae bacterium]|jgi:hypothetical protein
MCGLDVDIVKRARQILNSSIQYAGIIATQQRAVDGGRRNTDSSGKLPRWQMVADVPMLLSLRGMSVSRVLGLVLEKGLNWEPAESRPGCPCHSTSLATAVTSIRQDT